MKTFFVMLALLLCVVGANRAAAQDCTLPALATEIRLYANWSHFDYRDCSVGRTSDMKVEPQWKYASEAWSHYEEAMTANLSQASDVTVKSYSPQIVMFVSMKNINNADKAALALVELVDYTNRYVGEKVTDLREQTGPDIIERDPVIVFNDGQILIVHVASWSEGCGTKFHLEAVGEMNALGFLENTFVFSGAKSICSIQVTEVSP